MMGFVNTPIQNPLQNTYQENMFSDLLGRKDQLQQNAQVSSNAFSQSTSKVIKLFILKSNEYEIDPAHKC